MPAPARQERLSQLVNLKACSKFKEACPAPPISRNAVLALNGLYSSYEKPGMEIRIKNAIMINLLIMVPWGLQQIMVWNHMLVPLCIVKGKNKILREPLVCFAALES